jgi:alpha-glucoside transport system substrate-binding protein
MYVLIAGFALGMMATLSSSNAATAALQGETITFVTSFEGDELADFKRVVRAFEDQSPSGTKVTVEAVGRNLPQILQTRVAAGNPPDMTNFPQPGAMVEFARSGDLVPVDDMLSRTVLSQQPAGFLDLGTVDGKLYAITPIASLKSLVWYHKPTFEEKGYAIPQTYADLKAFTEQVAADGISPWCIGVESGAASGWPGTDWMEDIARVAHDIPWTDSRVKTLFEEFLFFADNAFGGRTNVLATNFGDSPNGLFDGSCVMHRQATFIRDFIQRQNPDVVAGVDFEVFTFPAGPAQDGGPAPALGGGDLFAAFSSKPGVAEFLNYIGSADAQRLWILLNPGRIATNTTLDPDVVYVNADGSPDTITANAAKTLTSAELFRFDGSDLMPSAVGAGTFWSAVLDALSGKDLDAILCEVEASADDAYTSGAATGPMGNCS